MRRPLGLFRVQEQEYASEKPAEEAYAAVSDASAKLPNLSSRYLGQVIRLNNVASGKIVQKRLEIMPQALWQRADKLLYRGATRAIAIRLYGSVHVNQGKKPPFAPSRRIWGLLAA